MSRKPRSKAPFAKLPLSAGMASALAEAIDHGGKLVRFDGYWSWPGNLTAYKRERFSIPTIDGLVDRGRMTYTEYREGRGTRIPVAAEVRA